MDEKPPAKPTGSEQDQNEKEYPPLKKVIPAMVAIYLAFFLIAIDRTIIGTAIPSITNTFQSFGAVAWYESGYLLPLCMLQLSFGRIYKYYSAKWTLIILVIIFEIGSIVSAAAPTSNALIVGRVISGIGGAGIAPGGILMITLLVPLQDRPKWTGGIGSVFGIASIVGPVLGGYLTSVTWRWCFWINVPVGAVSLVLLVLLTPPSPPPEQPADTWLGKVKDLDPLGFILIGPAVICLLFALEFGGVDFAWNSATIIALFVVFGVLTVAFVAVQVWKGDAATIPPRILGQRSIYIGSALNLGVGSLLVLFSFYLPIWFQVIQGKSPQSSGLSLLPLLLSNVFAVIGAGILTSIVGYYTPFLIVGSAFLVVGSALITTWEVNIGAGTWIGYQILAGFGLGLSLQAPNIAAQTVLPDNEVSIGLSVLNFFTFFGGTIFVQVAQTMLKNKLADGLKRVVPDLDPNTLSNGSATAIRTMVSKDQLSEVLKIYNNSIRLIWYLALGLSCWIFLTSWALPWKSVKKQQQKKKDEEAEPDSSG